jgi:hypothetical protein
MAMRPKKELKIRGVVGKRVGLPGLITGSVSGYPTPPKKSGSGDSEEFPEKVGSAPPPQATANKHRSKPVKQFTTLLFIVETSFPQIYISQRFVSIGTDYFATMLAGSD